MSTIQRRTLKFDSLDEVVRDAEHLLAAGCEPTGKWDLAQVCNHLAAWFRYQMDGFPPAPLPLRVMFWMMRNTVGKKLGRKMFEGGEMKPGLPTAPASVYEPGTDPAKAVAELRDTVARWQAHPEPLRPSPVFGPMTKDQYRKGHLIHCAHHLSYLVPRS